MENQNDPGQDQHPEINLDLAEWAGEYITLATTCSLLNVLRPHLPTLLQDARTLLKTPVYHSVCPINGGDYCGTAT